MKSGGTNILNLLDDIDTFQVEFTSIKYGEYVINGETFYSLKRAAFLLNCSRNTFEKKYVHTGLIRLTYINKRKYISRYDIDDFLLQLKNLNYNLDDMKDICYKVKRVIKK